MSNKAKNIGKKSRNIIRSRAKKGKSMIAKKLKKVI